MTEQEADINDTAEALSGWRVTDESSAAWAVDKILTARERTKPGGPRVTDEAAARRWAHRYLPDAIKVKVTTTVSATALKEYVEASGELPDGVERISAEEIYDVKAL